MVELFVKIFFGLVVLTVVIIFPGLNFREWLKKKFTEGENGEPITWK